MMDKVQSQNFSLNWFSLKDKVALVTGGASGIGQSYSIALAQAGADVFSVSASQRGWEKKLSKPLNKLVVKSNFYNWILQIQKLQPK